MRRWKTLSRETVFRTPRYTFDHDTFRLPGGEEGDYYSIRTPGAVMVVPVEDDGRIVLVRQYRYLLGRDSIEFPAGGVGPGGDFLEQAKKELAEEAALRAERWEEAGRFASWNGVTDEICRLYVATGLSPGEGRRDGTEEFEILRVRWDELLRMVVGNEIDDGMTLASITLARERVIRHIDR